MITRPEEPYRVCVCVCLCVHACRSNPLQLPEKVEKIRIREREIDTELISKTYINN